MNFFPASSNFSFFLNALGVPYLKIKNPSHSVQWRQTCAIQDYIYIYIHVQSSLNRIAEILESRKAIDHRIHISLGSSIHISYHNNSAPKVIDNLNQNHHKWHNKCVICLLQIVLVHPHALSLSQKQHTIHRTSHHHLLSKNCLTFKISLQT